MEFLIKDDKIGNLKIEKVFFSSYYPILFTCRNDLNELFLCVCCTNNENETRWLVAETDAEVIVQMLSDKITLREAFIKSNKKRFTIIKLRDSIKTISDWEDNNEYLPDKGEYIDSDSSEFDEEILFYKRQISS